MGQALKQILNLNLIENIFQDIAWQEVGEDTYPLFPGWELLTPIGEKIAALNCNTDG